MKTITGKNVDLEKEQSEMARNYLYRDYYRRTMYWLCIMVLVTCGLGGLTVFQVMHRSKPAYFAATTTGRVVPLQSLSMPVVTNNFLLQWAALAVRSAYNLDFVNMTNQLKSASQYFTPDGWSSFQEALQKAKILQSIENNKLMVGAVVDGPAVILAQAIVHGRHQWRVQLPLLVTYTSASEKRQMHFIVTLDIMRVPVIEAEKSIQINNFYATIAS